MACPTLNASHCKSIANAIVALGATAQCSWCIVWSAALGGEQHVEEATDAEVCDLTGVHRRDPVR